MTRLRSLLFAAFLALPFATSFAQIEFSVGWAPPLLPVYEQPACPVAGYIWTPGYWGWDSYYYDYYWVPGVWVPPPRVGAISRVYPPVFSEKTPPSTGDPFAVSETIPLGQVKSFSFRQVGLGGPDGLATPFLSVTYIRMI